VLAALPIQDGSGGVPSSIFIRSRVICYQRTACMMERGDDCRQPWMPMQNYEYLCSPLTLGSVADDGVDVLIEAERGERTSNNNAGSRVP